jgi:3-hydroxyacyl-[acyl-carrier-protein] dehydratase
LIQDLYQYKIHAKNDSEYILEVTFSDSFHPIFQAHFPNNHLLPGYLHIQVVADILQKDVLEIKKAKFVNQILPNDTIEFYVIEKEKNSLKVISKKEDKKYSEFIIVTK